MTKLKCDMSKDCNSEVTHIDSSGFIYCSSHGELRKFSKRCRKLKPKELKTLEQGQPLTRYEVG